MSDSAFVAASEAESLSRKKGMEKGANSSEDVRTARRSDTRPWTENPSDSSDAPGGVRSVMGK